MFGTPGSFRSRILMLVLACVFGVTVIWSALAYATARRYLSEGALRTAAMVATMRQESLEGLLERRIRRGREVLQDAATRCAPNKPGREECLRQILELFAVNEQLLTVEVTLPGLGELRHGEPPFALEPKAGQLAVFEDGDPTKPAGRRREELTFVIAARDGRGGRLAMRFSVSDVVELFSVREGLGESGETFLADPHGVFITPPRYPSVAGSAHSHPIDAEPMRRCLSGQNGEMIAPDYRGVDVVHAFRYIEEIGGGCIMAHIDEAEALTPARAMAERMLGLGALVVLLAAPLAVWTADRMIRPLRRATDRAERLSQGDFESPIETEGPAEVRAFAAAFDAMVRSLRDWREKNERLLAEAQTAVRVRDEFLSVASHELKTPLTSLQLRLQTLRRRTLLGAKTMEPQSLDGALRSAEGQARKLSTVIEGLLDVTRLGQGRLKLTREPVDLTAAAREVLAEFASEADRTGTPLVLDESVPVVGSWDRLRIEQVIRNLLSNALKYGAGAPIEVAVSAEGADGILVVRDRGIGIDPAKLQSIFGKFERAVSERNYGGLGLGLYISTQIVEALGGRIEVESEPGKGATFRVRLPLSPPAADALSPPSPA